MDLIAFPSITQSTRMLSSTASTSAHSIPSETSQSSMKQLKNTSSRYPDYFQHLNIPKESLKTLHMPSHWNTKDKCGHLELSRQQLRVTYTGPGKNDSDAAAVRANFSIPACIGLFYFEVTIISKGRDGYIAIGLSAQNVSLQRLPGWEQQSWGYHGDDGHSFNCSGTGKTFGPTFTTGDVIGCGFNRINCEVFYTKNGMFLGTAFKDIKASSIFPTVGLRTVGEQVEVNFGMGKRFKFDLEHYIEEQKQLLLTRIETELPPDVQDETKQSTNEIILSYLLHKGYTETATALSEHTPTRTSLAEHIQHANLRNQIRTHILNGDIPSVLNLLSVHHPQLVQRSHGIYFELGCRHFLDLLIKAFAQPDDFQVMQSALEYGQHLQEEYRRDGRQEVQQRLVNCFSVLAYPDPYASPVAWVLAESERARVAEQVNAACVVDVGGASVPCLERVLRQLMGVVCELGVRGDGAGVFLDMNELTKDSVNDVIND